jgi:hypothetical protein
VDPTTYKRLSKDELDEREEPDEVEISFEEDSVSTLGRWYDPIDDALGDTDTPEGKLIELPPIRM